MFSLHVVSYTCFAHIPGNSKSFCKTLCKSSCLASLIGCCMQQVQSCTGRLSFNASRHGVEYHTANAPSVKVRSLGFFFPPEALTSLAFCSHFIQFPSRRKTCLLFVFGTMPRSLLFGRRLGMIGS